jgi:hypothetical protein
MQQAAQMELCGVCGITTAKQNIRRLKEIIIIVAPLPMYKYHCLEAMHRPLLSRTGLCYSLIARQGLPASYP